ncbi:MAG TPA: nitrilase-related carbon-nitrogen hydrolase [Nitrosopumilaceae archaeon]|jgi:NAD+ synthase (glutamine-hydrolysing)|nr:nitrilase-related carbon-nitrogen hydrolase [Nitrosopumilaceae archaeon]
MKIKVSLAQIKTVTGDLQGNTERISECIQKAIFDKSDVVLFPETAITGYCCGALFNQRHFIDFNIKFLEKNIVPFVPDNLVVVIGFVDKYGTTKDGYPEIRNSVAVIQNKKIVGTYDKILLANGSHHEDRKYFTPGTNVKVFEVDIRGQKVTIGTPICEDVWENDHIEDIVKTMKLAGAHIILCPNQSYFYYGKENVRRKLFSGHAFDNQIPFVAVNAVGIGDVVKNIMIYDGGSMAFDQYGNMVAKAKTFAEDFVNVEFELTLDRSKMKIRNPDNQRDFYTYKCEQIFNALVFEQKELFSLLGIKKAQVHMSGGIDSSIVLPIVVEAMGKDNVIAISNPTHDNGDVTKSNAQLSCDILGVKLYWNSFESAYNELQHGFKEAFDSEPSNAAKSCIQAVGRTVQGLSATHLFGSGIVATGNHTEIVLGWSSFHDIGSIGVHSIIGDMTKMEIFQMANYINKRFKKDVVPVNLYDGSTKPAAELADAKDDPFDYWLVSGICAEIIRERKDLSDLIFEYQNKKLNSEHFPEYPNGKSIYENVDEKQFIEAVEMCFKRSMTSVFKSAQSAPVVIISPRSRGFSNRETIINKYAGAYEFNETKLIELSIKKLHSRLLTH